MRNALCALMLALAVWPLIARADDYGPSRTIAAIRHDLPVLLAAELRQQPSQLSGPQIAGVVVSGDAALAELGNLVLDRWVRVEQMRYRYDRWWIEGTLLIDAGKDNAESGPSNPLRSASSLLWQRAGIPKSLVALAIANLPLVPGATVRTYATPPPCPFSCFANGSSPEALLFTSAPQWLTRGGYRLNMQFAPNDAGEDTRIQDANGRAPTQAESWVTPGGNSYFFFSGTVQSTQPVHVQAGTTVDVWFPFVLDASLRYSLTIAGHGFTALGPVDGTLDDNTLHFVLPAFTVSPGVELMGEVESD